MREVRERRRVEVLSRRILRPTGRHVTMSRASVDVETALVDDVRRKRACANAQSVPLCLIATLCAYVCWEVLMSLTLR
jgi:hypothetical protein